MKKFLAAIYAVVAYLIFLVSFLYAIGFIGDFLAPKTIDSGAPSGTGMAIVTNLVLMSLFAIQHSLMARPAFKKWWTQFVPEVIERSTYVLFSSLILIVMYWQWQPMPTVIWEVQDPTGIMVLNTLFGLGWLIVLVSTFLINHFDLFGLQQVYRYVKSIEPRPTAFKMTLFYSIVRHPIMLGFIIAFWATPVMTAGHLLFAAVTTVYIYVAVAFLEERDLMKIHKETYREYQKNVPMLIPFSKFGKSKPASGNPETA